jgi:hypothetical protein
LEKALRERLQVLGPYGAREATEEVFLLQVEASGLSLEDFAEPGHESALFTRRIPDEFSTQTS